jgi:hypothetical protein
MVYGYLAALGVILCLFFLPVRLWLDYRHRGKTEDSMLVQFSIWGLLQYSLEVPVISTSEKGLALGTKTASKKKRIQLSRPSPEELGRYWRQYKELLRSLKRVFRFFRRSLKVKSFVWHTEFGIRDSARLAILTGSLWAVKGMVCAALHHLFSFTAPPVIRVFPRFNRNYFRVAFSCILEFPLGYAIITAFYAGFQAIKFKLKRRGAKIDRTSNPGSNEDGHGKYQGNGRCEYSNRRRGRGS